MIWTFGENGVVSGSVSGNRFVCCTLTVLYSMYNILAIDLTSVLYKIYIYIYYSTSMVGRSIADIYDLTQHIYQGVKNRG